MTDVGSARVEITGDVTQFARKAERDLNAAISKINLRPVDIDVDIDREGIGRQFAKVGTEAAGGMVGALGKGLSTLPGMLTSNPYLAAAGAAAAAAVAITFAPALAAALAGLIIGGAGLGVIGLGAWLLREQPALQQAGNSLVATLKGTFANAAAPLLGPLVAALGTFEGLIVKVGPQVAEMFKGLGESGAIEALAAGLAGLAEEALPGFLELVKASGPFLTSLGESLPRIGEALSIFFSAISEGGPGAALVFGDLLTVIGNSIAGLGIALGWLASLYPPVRQFFVDLGGWVSDAVGWLGEFAGAVAGFLAPLGPAFSAAWSLVSSVVTTAWQLISNTVSTAIDVIMGLVSAGMALVRGDWSSAWQSIKDTVSSVAGGIRNAVSILANGVPAILSAAMATARALWSAGWAALTTIVSGAVGRVRSAVDAVRGAITGAFSGAAGWLSDAGRKIINGLIDGIQSGFDRVRGLLNTLTGLLPDWKGPVEVDRKILFGAGQEVMKGFERGIEDQRDSIRRSLQDLTGDLPSWTGGTARGGDGAAAGSVTVTNHVNIYGQGREAGEEAAETILEKLGQAKLLR